MRILVVQLARMGDILQTTPLLTGLRERHPDAYIAVLVNKRFDHILSDNPDTDEIFTLDADFLAKWESGDFSNLIGVYSALRDFIYVLKDKEFDSVINISFNEVSSYITHILRCDDTKGFTRDEGDVLVVYDKWGRYFASQVLGRKYIQYNVVDIFQYIADVRPAARKLRYMSGWRNRDEYIESFFKERGIEEHRPTVGFQAGASRSYKRWPPEYFARLGDDLMEEMNATVLIFGSPQEITYFNRIKELMNHSPVNATNTNLAQLAALLGVCDLLVTNDTGPMHIATAVGCKVVDLSIGPSFFYNTGPYGEGHIILQPDIPCSPCDYSVVCDGDDCKKALVPDIVFKVSKYILCKGPDRRLREIEGALGVSNVRIYISGYTEDGVVEYKRITRSRLDEESLFGLIYLNLWRDALKMLDNPPMRAHKRLTEDIYNRISSGIREDYIQVENERFVPCLQRVIKGIDKILRLVKQGKGVCEKAIDLFNEPRINSMGTEEGIKSIMGEFNHIGEGINNIGSMDKRLSPLTSFFTLTRGMTNLKDIISMSHDFRKNFGETHLFSSLLKGVLKLLIKEFECK